GVDLEAVAGRSIYLPATQRGRVAANRVCRCAVCRWRAAGYSHSAEDCRLIARAEAVSLSRSTQRSKEAVCVVGAVARKIQKERSFVLSAQLRSRSAVRAVGRRTCRGRSSVATVRPPWLASGLACSLPLLPCNPWFLPE